MKDDARPDPRILLLMAALLVVAGFWMAGWIKASAYNRVTGKHVSAWDALVLDIRVQDNPK